MKTASSLLLPGGSPGPHLPLTLLRQYAAGMLPPEARHRVEAHTLDCARCADVLDGLLQTNAATTDAALQQLRGRLRQRVAAAPSRPTRRAGLRVSWLAPQLAAAAALLLVLLAGGWWAWQHRARQAAAPAIAALPGAARAVVRARAAAPAASAPARAAVQPEGGFTVLETYLQRGAAAFVPAGARLHGPVRLGLVVGANGRPTQVTVRQSLRADYDAEAQRLVRRGPRWAGQGATEVVVSF